MPTAKPRYDGDGSWKFRKFSKTEWDELGEKIRQKLRLYYPDKNAVVDPNFGHPADEWANILLSEAESSVSTMLWLHRRCTKAELRAEQADVWAALKKAEKSLSNLSHDFDVMLGVDADVLGCRDKLRELIPRVDSAKVAIARLPRATKLEDAQADACVEMAIRVLGVWKGRGGSMAATADTDLGRASDAVKILKILGDGLGLRLAERTWVTHITDAKRQMSE